MATNSQIKKIHTLKKVLGLDDDLYRELLDEYGVNSSKDLTYKDAIAFTENLESKALALGLWEIKPKKYSELNRNNEMATDSQLRMIEGLWRELSYFDNDKFAKKSLRKFLNRTHKIDDVMFLTKEKASKVIHSIIAMKKNYIKKSVATL
ncbi:regulatory protein GemA [bacterium]|nr:regulatory protein GemA [bacterium]